jgi:hypothetical protein
MRSAVVVYRPNACQMGIEGEHPQLRAVFWGVWRIFVRWRCPAGLDFPDPAGCARRLSPSLRLFAREASLRDSSFAIECTGDAA